MITAATAAALGLVLGAGLWWPDLGRGPGQEPGHPPLTRLPEPAACALEAGPCTGALPGGGAVTVSLAPRPVPLLDPVTVTVTVAGSRLEPEELRVTGRSMEMGLQRARLEAAASGADPGTYEGTFVLPVCSSRRMEWEALVVLAAPGRRVALPLPFQTRR